MIKSFPPLPDVVTIDSSRINIKSYHDGFRISWPEQNFADNLAISYHLQAARGDKNYIIIYRGSATKYTWKLDFQPDISYKLVTCSITVAPTFMAELANQIPKYLAFWVVKKLALKSLHYCTKNFTFLDSVERFLFCFRFRLQVRTTEGVGNWSQPKEARRAEPGKSFCCNQSQDWEAVQYCMQARYTG